MSLNGCFPFPNLHRIALVNKEALWKPPEISGWLEKQNSKQRKNWSKRFFILKGSYLFYFRHSSAKDPDGMIPLEYAMVESSEESKELDTLRYTIEIQLHKAYEECCVCMTYKLASSKPEIQEAWLTALSRAILPLRLLVRELNASGKLEALMSNAEAAQRSWKSKISFFRPGQLLDERVESTHRVGSDNEESKPDPLNTAVFPSISTDFEDPEAPVEERTQPSRNRQEDDLQTIIDRRFSRTSSLNEHAQPGVILSSLIPQSSTTESEKIPAVYEWDEQRNPSRRKFSNVSHPEDENREKMQHRTRNSFLKEHVGTHPPLSRVHFTEIDSDQSRRQSSRAAVDDDSLDELSEASLSNVKWKRSIATLPEQLAVTAPDRLQRLSEKKENSQFPGFDTSIDIRRSRTDEQDLSSLERQKLHSGKRQTVYSYVNPTWRKSASSFSYPRQSKFLPYIPSSILNQEPGIRKSVHDHLLYENAIYEAESTQMPVLNKILEEPSSQGVSFEDELKEKLRQRRTKIDALEFS